VPLLERDGVNLDYEAHGQGLPPCVVTATAPPAECGMGQIAALASRYRIVVSDMGPRETASPTELLREAIGGVSAASALWPLIDSLNPSADVVAAGASVDLDLTRIQPAEQKIVAWARQTGLCRAPHRRGAGSAAPVSRKRRQIVPHPRPQIPAGAKPTDQRRCAKGCHPRSGAHRRFPISCQRRDTRKQLRWVVSPKAGARNCGDGDFAAGLARQSGHSNGQRSPWLSFAASFQ
jgi:hypothetical protein